MEVTLVPVSLRAYLWLFGLTVAPLIVIGIYFKSFHPTTGFKTPLIVAGLVLALTFGLAWAMSKNSLKVEEEYLHVRVCAFYGGRYLLTDINWSRARAGELASMPEFSPTLRVNGVGLPGYRAGWFALKAGGEALLSITDPGRVIALPMKDGKVIMVSVNDPESVLRTLSSGGR